MTEALFGEGFTVHGLDTNYENTAWHDGNDIPLNNSMWNLGSSEVSSKRLHH